jgi:hypothetical protein
MEFDLINLYIDIDDTIYILEKMKFEEVEIKSLILENTENTVIL